MLTSDLTSLVPPQFSPWLQSEEIGTIHHLSIYLSSIYLSIHSQTYPSIAKSAIEVIPRKRNVKIRGKPETKIWNLLCFGIRNLQR